MPTQASCSVSSRYPMNGTLMLFPVNLCSLQWCVLFLFD
uniref:Uncharacterized protein n=1 Tax=Triticum urartu TaxID=4572 RepID=A0A8R7QGA2_TRIUA